MATIRVISTWLLLPFGFLFTFLTVVGVVGNILVIIAIAADRKMRKMGLNILLLNLAVADLMNLLLNTCEWVPTVSNGRIQWVLPDKLCGVWRYLEYSFLYVSILTQIIISIERYIAIILPIHARRFCTRKKALQAVAAAWAFVAVFAYPYLHYHGVKYDKMGGSCSNSAYLESWWQKYKTAEFFVFYLFPCAVIIIVYWRIGMCLWANNPELLLNSKRSNKNDILRTRRSVIKMLCTCVFVYFVCYSPIQALFISKTVFHQDFHISYQIILGFNALAMTCSAANPLVYTLFSMKFRRRIRSLLACQTYVRYRVPLLSARVRESNVYVSNYTTD